RTTSHHHHDHAATHHHHAAADDHHHHHAATHHHHAAADDYHDHAAPDHDHDDPGRERRLPVRYPDGSDAGPHRAEPAQADIPGAGGPVALRRAMHAGRQQRRPVHEPVARLVGLGCPPRLLQAGALERGREPDQHREQEQRRP